MIPLYEWEEWKYIMDKKFQRGGGLPRKEKEPASPSTHLTQFTLKYKAAG